MGISEWQFKVGSESKIWGELATDGKWGFQTHATEQGVNTPRSTFEATGQPANLSCFILDQTPPLDDFKLLALPQYIELAQVGSIVPFVWFFVWERVSLEMFYPCCGRIDAWYVMRKVKWNKARASNPRRTLTVVEQTGLVL
jgi:hypothetical protein